ncbi:tRNA (adenosine(37)-N6)-dimethylallyltransferase MiaA [Gymnodinialimonas sp. 57CJ19]|uniref:tRNA (adenosine(37)-N6)-dimethylallyltransferase MiaA n=1 Tax=Gymnodinialimonas sp. 57CJ19 TaxID=3138498 RepID=UPI00313428DF
MIDIASLPTDKPVLIAGPTASGKTALAISIAQAQSRVIVNADALQVYDGWRVLTARPSPEETSAAPHHLFGHVPFTAHYDVGQWLRDVTPFLPQNPVIVGGTGLYFRALTQGLADIPPVPADVRARADALPSEQLLAELRAGDPALADRIDCHNRMRVQRGWEVLRATGRPLSAWQDETAPPLLPLPATTAFALMPDRDWLNTRIAQRFDQMMSQGALIEAQQNLPLWPQAGGAAKAIGAPELIAHLQGTLTLDAAREAAIIATRQYAKRQRSWLRSNTKHWTQVTLP